MDPRHDRRDGDLGALGRLGPACGPAAAPDAFLEVRYEDLVAAPRQELERLCSFLGEDFEEAMLQPHVAAERLPANQRDGWHRHTRAPVGPGRVGTYAGVLTPAEVGLVESVAGTRLRSLGYPVDGSGHASPAALARTYLSLTGMRVRTRFLAVNDRLLARPRGSVADRG